MDDKIADLKKAKQEKRDNNGWNLEEIKKNAEKELINFRTLAEYEPDNLVSGRIESAFEDKESDED